MKMNKKPEFPETLAIWFWRFSFAKGLSKQTLRGAILTNLVPFEERFWENMVPFEERFGGTWPHSRSDLGEHGPIRGTIWGNMAPFEERLRETWHLDFEIQAF